MPPPQPESSKPPTVPGTPDRNPNEPRELTQFNVERAPLIPSGSSSESNPSGSNPQSPQSRPVTRSAARASPPKILKQSPGGAVPIRTPVTRTPAQPGTSEQTEPKSAETGFGVGPALTRFLSTPISSAATPSPDPATPSERPRVQFAEPRLSTSSDRRRSWQYYYALFWVLGFIVTCVVIFALYINIRAAKQVYWDKSYIHPRSAITLEDAMTSTLSPGDFDFKWLPVPDQDDFGHGRADISQVDEILYEEDRNLRVLAMPPITKFNRTEQQMKTANMPNALFKRFYASFEPNMTTIVSNNSIFSMVDYHGYNLSPSRRYVLFWTNRRRAFRHSHSAKYFVYDLKDDLVLMLSTIKFWSERKRPDFSRNQFTKDLDPDTFQTLETLPKFLTSQDDDDYFSRFSHVDWFKSPKGDSLIMVQKNNIFVLPEMVDSEHVNDTSSTRHDHKVGSHIDTVIKLSGVGQPNTFYCGIPDWLYEEEIMSGHKAYSTSLSGKHLAFMKINDRNVDTVPIATYGPGGAVLPQANTIRYPKTGRVNPRVTVTVVANVTMKFARQVEISERFFRKKFEQYYVHRIRWLTDRKLALVYTNREQTRLVAAVCYEEKNFRCKSVLDIEMPYGWVDVIDDIYPYTETHFLIILPRRIQDTGLVYRHIALVSTWDKNNLTFVTGGLREVTEINGVDRNRHLVYYTSTIEDDPGQRQVFVSSLAIPSPLTECITCLLHPTRCLYNSVSMSPSFEYYVFFCQGPDIPRIELRHTRNIQFRQAADEVLDAVARHYPQPTTTRGPRVYTLEPPGPENATRILWDFLTSTTTPHPFPPGWSPEPEPDLHVASPTPAPATGPTAFKAPTAMPTPKTKKVIDVMGEAESDDTIEFLREDHPFANMSARLKRLPELAGESNWLMDFERNHDLEFMVNFLKETPINFRLEVPIPGTNYSAHVLLILPPVITPTTLFRAASPASAGAKDLRLAMRSLREDARKPPPPEPKVLPDSSAYYSYSSTTKKPDPTATPAPVYPSNWPDLHKKVLQIYAKTTEATIDDSDEDDEDPSTPSTPEPEISSSTGGIPDTYKTDNPLRAKRSTHSSGGFMMGVDASSHLESRPPPPTTQAPTTQATPTQVPIQTTTTEAPPNFVLPQPPRQPAIMSPLLSRPTYFTMNSKKDHDYKMVRSSDYLTEETIGSYIDQIAPGTKMPMLVDVYGGPGVQRVDYRFSMGFGHYIASSKRVIYAIIDGRGSGFDGVNRMHEVYKKLGTVEVQDQIDTVKYLTQKYSFIDANKVGIWGWSYGGYAAGMALAKSNKATQDAIKAKLQTSEFAAKANAWAKRNENNSVIMHEDFIDEFDQETLDTLTQGVFECAASVAPVASWIYYDTAYTERYMGSPYLNGKYDFLYPGDHLEREFLLSKLKVEEEEYKFKKLAEISPLKQFNHVAPVANEWLQLDNNSLFEVNHLYKPHSIWSPDDETYGPDYLPRMYNELGPVPVDGVPSSYRPHGPNPGPLKEYEPDEIFRFNGLTDQNEHYKRASLLDIIHHIGNKRFLLIHGTADDNVHFQNSALLMKRLIQNNVQFESKIYPDQEHGIGTRMHKVHLSRSIVEFFDRCFDLIY